MIYIEKGKVYLGTAAPSSGGGGQTINNQDITITANGEYTAAAGYTGIGTATVNVPNPSTGTLSITSNGTYNVTSYASADVNCPEPDIVSATNTTGSAISSGDKVWLQKITGGWNIINNVNFDTIGSPTIANQVISGFSQNDYIQLKDTFSPGNDNWEIQIKFKPTSVSGGQNILQKIVSGTEWVGFQIALSDNKLYYLVSSTTTSYLFEGTGSNTVVANTWQYVNFVFSGTQYVAKYSTDGLNWVDDKIYSSSSKLANFDSPTTIGVRVLSGVAGPNVFDGEIDLAETYIRTHIFDLWTPYSKIDSRDFSGIAEEAIAVNGTGDVKTALGGGAA